MRSHIFSSRVSSERELLVIEQLNRFLYLIWLNDFRIQRRSSSLSDRPIHPLRLDFSCPEDLPADILFLEIHEREEQVVGAPHSNLHGDLEEEKERGETKRASQK